MILNKQKYGNMNGNRFLADQINPHADEPQIVEKEKRANMGNEFRDKQENS